MLIQLTPEQVSSYWQEIKPGIVESLPPYLSLSEEAITNILQGLIKGVGQVWVWVEDAEAEQIGGVFVTTFRVDPLSGARTLLLYSAYAEIEGTAERWKEVISTLKKFAEGNDCNGVVAYTNQEWLAEKASMMGADTSFHLLDF